MSQLRFAIPILAAAVTVTGPFASQALGQKSPEADTRTGNVLSSEADVKAKTPPVAPATAPVPAQRDQDEILPGSGSHSQWAPFYTVGEGFMTMLMLNNGTRAGFSVKVTLYSPEGEPAELPSIHLNAHETKDVDLNEWVAGLGAQYVSGSLRLDYRSTPYALGAMVMMVNERQSLEVDVLARPKWEFKSNRLEAMWWRPARTTEVHYAIQNTAESQVRGKLTLTDSDGHALKSMPLDMAPHQTRIYKLHELLDDAMLSHKVGGISIEHLGSPGDLRAQSFVLRRNIGFSASLQFEDPQAAVDSQLEGAGVLIGDEETFGRPKLFSGHLLLRNVSVKPVTVKAQVQRGAKPDPLPDVHLEAGEAREILVPANSLYSADKGQGTAGVALQYTGAPGNILAYWFSVDNSASLVVETPLRNPAGLPQAGSNPWSLEGDYSSVLYVKNTATKPSSFVADIFYRGGYYMIGMKTLEAGETTAIDIRKLRDEQIPDVNGQRLPPRLTSGQINWRTRVGNPRLVGRVNTMSVSKGLANNMSCSTCCGCTDVSFSLQPASWTGALGSTFSFTPVETDSNSCNRHSFPVSPSWFTWSSTNPNIASVDQSAAVSCRGGGSATVSGDGFFSTQIIDTTIDPPAGGCFACTDSSTEQTPSGPVTVCPTTVTVAAKDNIPLENLFPNAKTGIGIVATMQVGPQASGPFDGDQITEAVSDNFVMQATCPTSFGPYCRGSDTFTVGLGASGFGVTKPAAPNTFYDFHTTVFAVSLLDAAGMNSCTVSCNQTYSCGGNIIGSFLITRDMSKDAIQNTPVTRVTVTKQ